MTDKQRQFLGGISLLICCLLLPNLAYPQCDFGYSSSWTFDFEPMVEDALPTTHRVSSVLENLDPHTVVEPFDTGGVQTGTLPFFAAVGGSWVENQYFLNGTDITDPYLPGRPLLDPELDSLAEVKTVTAAKRASISAQGTTICLSLLQPSEILTGGARFSFSADALQSENTPAEAPLVPNSRLSRWYDGSLHVRGAAGGIPLFFGASGQHLTKSGSGDVRGHQISVAAAAQISQLQIAYAGGQLSHSGEDNDYTSLPGANAEEEITSHLISGDWRHVLGASTFNIHAGYIHADVTSASDAQLIAQSSPIGLLLPRSYTSSQPPPLLLNGKRSRVQVDVVDEIHIRNEHAMQFGFHWDRASIRNDISAPSAEPLFLNDIPREALFWNSETPRPERIQNFSLFVEDEWKPAARVLLPFGLRWEILRGNNTAQTISWSNLEPRARAVFQVKKRVRLSAGWARYGHSLQGRFLDFGNPGAFEAQVFQWNDSNHNNVFDHGEEGTLLSRFGGSYSGIDPDLRRPMTDEITIDYEQQFSESFSLTASVFRRNEHNLVAVENTGVPPSTYSSVPFTDPGNDGIPGTSDDSVFTVFSRDPALLGNDFLVLTNPDFANGTGQGFQIRLKYRPNPNILIHASLTGTLTNLPTAPGSSLFQNDSGVAGTLGADPNTLLLAKSTSYFDRGYVAKLCLIYSAVHDWRLGIVARYYDGLPFARLLQVDGLAQGPFYIRTTPRANFPDGFRTQFNSTLDFRIEKNFRIHGQRWIASFQGFNVLNMALKTHELDLTSPNFSDRPAVTVQSPRVLHFELGWRFGNN